MKLPRGLTASELPDETDPCTKMFVSKPTVMNCRRRLPPPLAVYLFNNQQLTGCHAIF
jgi:hypothetical protein